MTQTQVTHTRPTNTTWYVYVILCSDNTLYTGITTDMSRRWQEHKEKRGAKYFRGRSPVELLLLEPRPGRSHASQREYKIKQLDKKQKLRLCRAYEATTREQIARERIAFVESAATTPVGWRES
ncbi:MAG: hypothetical protein CSB48_03455 [Proteobacteria bacterium]|nr:MAG: hypothetical protein CSB48_03455 [Pseudomonadota bacterium]